MCSTNKQLKYKTVEYRGIRGIIAWRISRYANGISRLMYTGTKNISIYKL